MFRLSFLILLLLNSTSAKVLSEGLMADVSQIEFKVTPDKILPGKVFHLEVKIVAETYPQLEFAWEDVDGILLLGEEQHPVDYSINIGYKAGHTWILQAIKPGFIDFSSIQSKLTLQGRTYENRLKFPGLEIGSFQLSESNDRLEAWDPSFMESQNTDISYWFIMSCAFLIIAGFLWIFYQCKQLNKQVLPESFSDSRMSLQNKILEAMHMGEWPVKEIEKFFLLYGEKYDQQGRSLFQKILYSNHEVSSLDGKQLSHLLKNSGKTVS
ncbi:MAG: hypothetical protein AAGA18_04605 [Verrucomicrobiota bacterium]